jgi:hypothetical protein
MLCFVERSGGAEHLRSLAESCSRQIRAWADSLQNSDIKGQRHLNDQSSRRYEADRRAEAFQRRLDDVLRQARPQDFPDPQAT